MHEDERRDPELTREMILDEFVADPEALRRAYLGLVERDRLARLRADESTRRISDLASSVERLERRLAQVEAQKKDLSSRLIASEGALEAYRRETRRLKDDLVRVRGSRSMRIGRAITGPISRLRPRADDPAPAALEAHATSPTEDAAIPTEDAAAPTDVATQAPAASDAAPAAVSVGSEPAKDAPADPPAKDAPVDPPAKKLWELSFEELQQELAENPTGNVLNALLNRAWFRRGDIALCERLIAAHPDLVAKFPQSGKELLGRVQGEARLRDGRIAVPPRAHGAAYRPETGRVMYCVHSTPVYDSNGYSTRTRGLVDGLQQAGVDVSVVSRLGYPWDMHPEKAPRGPARSVTRIGEIDYTHHSGADLNRDPLDEYILKAADAYTREARVRRPAVIHAASNFRHALPALIAARRLGIPFVYEVRGLWELTEAVAKEGWEGSERFALQVAQETLVATEADQVLAITAQVRDELVARGVDPARIELAPNAVNEDEFVPLPADGEYAKKVGVKRDRPVIGFAGSLVAYEGLDVLLRAVRRIRDRDVPAQVLIAGSGAAREQLQKLTAQLDLGDDVRFLGRVPAQDIPRLMSIMDVMPCPRLSTRVTEMVSPLKPLEALSSGKAVILSDVTPQADLIPEGSGRGFLVPAGDEEALADRLEEVLRDSDAARSASRAGRRWILENRTWAVQGREIQRVYGRARASWDRALEDVPHRPLESLRVGIIADEFTTATFGARIQLVPIPREDPASALDDDLDAVLIESAWEGNGGSWHRGVGYYDDDQFAAMRRLIWAATQKGIPTIFWNKEDPVHVKRFLRTAVRCTHVFTTDSGLLGRYLASGSAAVRTASALPFFADLSLHNPVQRPADLQEARAMYAGTFYGERYAERSQELATLLRAAAPVGLDIYDRQAGNPDSPYRFPHEFAPHVRGSLPYSEVLGAYRSHLANLNVNSVTDSPTMFSRRVVEVAASGGVVLSGPGRGIVETFGGAIPASRDASFHRAHLRRWAAEPATRLAEAWFQLRTIARSHTSTTALAIMFRTVGIAVDGLSDPAYVAVLPGGTPDAVRSAAGQSVPPIAIAVPAAEVEAVSRLTDIPVLASDQAQDAARDRGAVIVEIDALGRTIAEDLLIARRFRGDAVITAYEAGEGADPRLLAVPAGPGEQFPPTGARIGRLEVLEDGDRGPEIEHGELMLLQPPAHRPSASADAEASAALVDPAATASGEVAAAGAPRTILFAGHDLKFVAPYMDALRAAGHKVLVDTWTAHNEHDEAVSRELLNRADSVWCEWGLGNAVWYSKHISAEQALVVRVHLQEIDLPYLRRIDADAVDSFIFVGELIRAAGIASHGIPAAKSVVIPNFVRAQELALPKSERARRTLGLVGIVPQRKRLDLAVDLVELLRESDPEFRLRVKGKRPEEYWWMARRPEEMAYYHEVYARIAEINERAGTEVIGFDGHGDDMPQWYQGIGTVISTSDFESFHLTLADGAASGSDAVSLAWAGADLIYPASMLYSDVPSMAAGLLDADARDRRTADLAARVREFDAPHVFDQFSRVLLPGAER